MAATPEEGQEQPAQKTPDATDDVVVKREKSRAPSSSKGRLVIRKANMKDKIPEYDNPLSMVFGVIQIVLGFLCIVLGIVAVVVRCSGYYSGIGIWGGMIIMAAGVLGVLSYKTRIAGLVVACFALACVCVVIGLLMLIMVGYFLGQDVAQKDKYIQEAAFWRDQRPKHEAFLELADSQNKKIPVDAVLLVCGLIEIVFAVFQAWLVAKAYLIRAPLRGTDSEGQDVPLKVRTISEMEWAEYDASPKADQEWQEYRPTRRPASFRGEAPPRRKARPSSSRKEKSLSQEPPADDEVLQNPAGPATIEVEFSPMALEVEKGATKEG